MREKRLSMINYTLANIKNGFWSKIDKSLHCIPYTMVPKKKDGVIYRYRPAFDGRVVNRYCYLMESNMPTLKDIRDLHSIIGFVTMADIKNCFDCIPLSPLDRQYACCLTPLGIMQMHCLTYGWKNAAPNAQDITNRLCAFVGLSLAYLDDINIKHPINYGTKQIVAHIKKLFVYCDNKNILLDPSKFYPCAEEAKGFAFSWKMRGVAVSKEYQQKVLALRKPTTGKDLETWLGVVGYIRNFIYNCSFMTYWMGEMRRELAEKGKLVWTPQATIAYNQLLYLLSNLPVLHSPTRDGLFAIQTDASNYGAGAVLYQQQHLPNEDQPRWVIVDMWSQVMPKQLRHCHSMVHEAYAVVHAVDRWQYYLMKRRFLISTDNEPVGHLFKQDKWTHLPSITRKQLARLIGALTGFEFAVFHVPGVQNILADNLSRFTAKLVRGNPDLEKVYAITGDDEPAKTLVTNPSNKDFIEYKEKTKTLSDTYLQLRHNTLVSVLNGIIPDVDNQYQWITHADDINWSKRLKLYLDSSKYYEKPRIQDLLQSGYDLTLRGSEYDLNDTSFTKTSGADGIISNINCIMNLIDKERNKRGKNGINRIKIFIVIL